jgi:hypothetical protein
LEGNGVGVLFDPVDNFARMLRDSVPFSRWCGLATFNAELVAARVFVEGFRGLDETLTAAELAAFRPYALIYVDTNRGHEWRYRAASNCWDGAGVISCVLSRAYDETKSVEQHWIEAAQLLEPIISNEDGAAPGLLELSRTPGYLGFNRITAHYVGRTALENVADYGDAYDVLLSVEY